MQTVLITGVAGFLGSRLASFILDNFPEYQVVGVDDLSGGFLDNVDKRVVFYQMDLSETRPDEIFQKHNVDIIYHFACYAAEGLSPFLRSYNYRNNIGATVNMINCAITYGCKRFVYASSMSVYGQGINPPPFDEDMNLCPIDPYGISKYACEMDIKVAYEQHRLNYVVVRPHNFYGPGQNLWDKYRNVLAIWMYSSLNGLPITVFGDGKQRRAFSYVDDSLLPLWRMGVDASLNGQTINLGGTKEVSIGDAAKMVSNITGNTDIVFLEPRHEVKDAWSTYEKSVRLVGFEHKTSFEMGIVSMWEWAKKQPKREQKVWDQFEITKGLYNFWRNDGKD